MQIHLNVYNLLDWQYDWFQEEITREIPIRTRVCPLNNCKTLGIIIDMQEPKKSSSPNYSKCKTIKLVREVTVVWLTGSKKGKKEVKETKNLINYDAWKAQVSKEVAALEANEAEAAKTGM